MLRAEVPEYIGNLLSLTRKLHSRIFRAQENIASLLREIYSWAMLPVLQRKDLKAENLLALAERDDNFQKRYSQIERVAMELNRILDENYKLFFNLLPDWIYERDEFELDESNVFSLVSRAREKETMSCGNLDDAAKRAVCDSFATRSQTERNDKFVFPNFS